MTRTCRSVAEALRLDLSDLKPADMVDVQGFIWCVFSIPDVWFGGVRYGNDDMLPRFQKAQVYAIGFGAEPSVRSLVAGAAESPSAERKLRAQAIAGATEKNASVALANFIELAARPGSIVLAKATYANSMSKVSIVRVRGIARTGKPPTGYDDALGHTVSVEWLGSADLRIKTTAFNKISATLAPIKLADALDIIGGEEVSAVENVNGIADPPVLPKKEIEKAQPANPPPPQPALPKNLILYGPPGTGKTFRRLVKWLPSLASGNERSASTPASRMRSLSKVSGRLLTARAARSAMRSCRGSFSGVRGRARLLPTPHTCS